MSEDKPILANDSTFTEDERHTICEILAEMVPEEEKTKALIEAYMHIDSLRQILRRYIMQSMKLDT